MMPRSPHRVTMGTGERRINPTVVLIETGQEPMGPRGVDAQSKPAMISASFPPPARKPSSELKGVSVFIGVHPIVAERAGLQKAHPPRAMVTSKIEAISCAGSRPHL